MTVHFGSYIISYEPDTIEWPNHPFVWRDTYDDYESRLTYQELAEYVQQLRNLMTLVDNETGLGGR